MIKGSGGFLHPETVLGQLSLNQGIKVAHFGCGNGYFTMPVAKLIGPSGLIYAIDVLPQCLDMVQAKAASLNLKNIQTLRCNLESSAGCRLPAKTIDLVLIINVLYQSQKKQAIVEEAAKVLKPQGELLIIDWLKNTPLAPKIGWLMDKAEAKNLIETAGFRLQKELAVNDKNFGFLFLKSN